MSDLSRTVNFYVDEINKSYENGELLDYVNDNAYDVEIISGMDKEYRGARLLLAGGGPTVYLDTRTGYVEGFWGTESYSYPIDSDANSEIDSYFEEVWNS